MEKSQKVPSAQTSAVTWELHWKTAQLCSVLPRSLVCPDPVRPVPAMLVLGVGWGESSSRGLHCSSSGPCFLPRKAVKATLVLLPLLGITYMLFFVNPGEDEISRIVFIYFNSFLESFQVWSSALSSIPVSPPRDVEELILVDALPCFCPLPKPDIPKPRVAPKLLSLGLPAGCSSAVTLLLISFQGFFVSVFYCFLNSEVSTGCWRVLGGAGGGSTPFLARRHKLSLRLCLCTGLGGCWHPIPQLKAFADQKLVLYLQFQAHLQPQVMSRWEWLLSVSSYGGGKSTPENRCSRGAPM